MSRHWQAAAAVMPGIDGKAGYTPIQRQHSTQTEPYRLLVAMQLRHPCLSAHGEPNPLVVAQTGNDCSHLCPQWDSEHLTLAMQQTAHNTASAWQATVQDGNFVPLQRDQHSGQREAV